MGRSGAYIVIHSMVKRIHDSGDVNVYDFLSHIRQQRNHLVQEEVCTNNYPSDVMLLLFCKNNIMIMVTRVKIMIITMKTKVLIKVMTLTMKMIIDNDDDDEDNDDDNKYDDYSDNDDDDDFFICFLSCCCFLFSVSTYLFTMHCFITSKAVLG